MIERREGEGMTEFTIRRIRAEIIEECAKAVEGEFLAGETNYPEDQAYDQAIRDAADAVRALVSTPSGSGK